MLRMMRRLPRAQWFITTLVTAFCHVNQAGAGALLQGSVQTTCWLLHTAVHRKLASAWTVHLHV